MDHQTILAYNQNAEAIAQLHSSLMPHRLYELADHYFKKNGATLDVGCGIGRDTAWLNNHGYPALGVDGSLAMLKQAEVINSGPRYLHDVLPKLEVCGDARYFNIFCAAVLMHLGEKSFRQAWLRLLTLLADDGSLIVSFRTSNAPGGREHGKLYQAINVDELIALCHDNHCEMMINETYEDPFRGFTWSNLVIKKIGIL